MTRKGRLWPAILAGWALAAVVLTATMARDIAGLWFPDTDDAMRLVEVRDWLNGQSWWDVSQHRLNDGIFAMHWSRLVDLPLAAVIAPLDPLIGPGAATRAAMTLVPLLTLLAIMALAALVTRRLLDTERAKLALLLVPLSVPIVFQARPLRIDHHGWQVALALGAVLALLSRPGRWSGIALGITLGTLVIVSMEGFPIACAIMGVAAFAWAIDPERRDQLIAAAGSWIGTVIALHAATRGPAMFAPVCDAVAPGWIAMLGVACLGMITCALLVDCSAPGAMLQRLAALAACALVAAATLVLVAPDCLHGPFAQLDPLVRTMWYDNVWEGLPLWDQMPIWALVTIGLPVVGLTGTVLALRQSQGEARARWWMMLGVTTAGFALSLFVFRAGATANALAVPGAAWLLSAMLMRARRIGPVLPRTAATAGAFALAAPGLLACALLDRPAAAAATGAHPTTTFARTPCVTGHEIAALAQLPAGTVFAPLDVTPEILATTPHRAIAAGYHRNDTAIHRVLADFMADPAAARGDIVASGATYVAGCPGANETALYRAKAPGGLWARLERGERFDWLMPLPIAGSPVLAWRVIAPAYRPLSPARSRS